MRKTIPVLLLFVFTMTSLIAPLPVQAADSLSVREAAELVKGRVEIPQNIKSFTSNYSEYNSRGQWNLHWSGGENDLEVTVDSQSGDIVRLYRYNRTDDEYNGRILTVSQHEALTTAQNFLKKALPGKYDSLTLAQAPWENSYCRQGCDYVFWFERVNNGIGYPANNAEIRVAGSTGQIEDYHLEWDYNASFPSAENIISLEEAHKIIKGNQGLELMYHRTPKEDNPSNIILVWSLRDADNIMVDAITGEYQNDNRYYNAMCDKCAMGGAGMGMAQDEALSPLENEEIEAIEGLLSKTEAAEKASSLIGIDDSFTLQHASLHENYREKEKRIWSFNWSRSGENNSNEEIYAQIDARTGDMYHFSKNNPYSDSPGTVRYSLEETSHIASNYIKKLQPQKARDIKPDKRQLNYIDKDSSVAYHNYCRLVNNIPFYEDGFIVNVDRVTGEVISYNMSWLDDAFPSRTSKISLEKAFSQIESANPVTLNYLKTYSSNEKLPFKTGLYYHFSKNEPLMINAWNGKLLTYSGEEFKISEKPQFNDIQGSPAEQDIMTLADLGIIQGQNSNYYPDRMVTNAEFIKMLVLAIGASPGEGEKLDNTVDNWYTPYYQTAVSRKIFTKNDLPEPGETIKRIDAARWMMTASDLQKVASLQGIYAVPTADKDKIENDDKGFAAISLGFKIIKPVNNTFAPQASITRAEAASSLVQLMRTFNY